MPADSKYYIETNRAFTLLRKYSWIFTLTIAIGGLWFPKLGLFVLPIMAGLTITAFFKGRYWCGNICPHGSLFDSLLMPLSKNKKIPDFLKSKYVQYGFFIFFSFQVGRKFIDAWSNFGQQSFFDQLGMIFVASYLMVTILGGLATIFISPRTWCQFCPMGTLQRFSYKVGKILNVASKTDKKVTIESEELCKECGLCSKACPMQLEPYKNFNEDGQFESEECIRCDVCVQNCPINILEIKSLDDENNEDLKNAQ
ncbi:4Fe-4S binding protein [Halanaerobium hydrogeniformans]|uniref:4Fe-4S ferredoxin iron-sulfur binding domain-containing protein n=1 Tax=Halanaerobium hydrogeniformans TaxID=656519 RepID=E4RLL4_HALHG|nr:4Fe-4S binding protein [Halanaerobium hydrogeniformans]ADQ14928.1 4Fe-4S ferredoxin iron-sulfur binding domain-containing protein [Halanaerobium hydrogeniformans]